MNLISREEPIEISSVADLSLMGKEEYSHSKFILTDDINLNKNSPYSYITRFLFDMPPFDTFDGVLDGQNHSIKGLQIDQSSTKDSSESLGLFKINRGEIRNLCMENVSIKSKYSAGGIAGNNYGDIINCSVTGEIWGSRYAGGLVAMNYQNGTISNCLSQSLVRGEGQVGGCIGFNRGDLVESYSGGKCEGEYPVANNTCTGGLVGVNWSGNIVRCASSSDVICEPYQNTYVGGLVGHNKSTISDSYFTGNLFSGEHVGIMIGKNMGCVTNSYYNTTSDYDVSGMSIECEERVSKKENLSEISKSILVGKI